MCMCTHVHTHTHIFNYFINRYLLACKKKKKAYLLVGTDRKSRREPPYSKLACF